MEQPSYYTITPAPIRYSDAPPREILMYGEITALSNKYGYCTAGNDYFARLYGKEKETVSGWITDMVKRGWIRRELIMEGNQVKQRRLYLEPLPVPKKSEGVPDKNRGGYPKKIREGTRKNLKENSTSVNTTSINREEEKDSRADLNAMEYFNSIGIHLNAIQIEDFIDYSKQLSEEVMKYAAEETARYLSKPKWSYAAAMMDDFINAGVKTVAGAKKRQESFKNKRAGKMKRFKQPKPPIDFTDSHRFDDM